MQLFKKNIFSTPSATFSKLQNSDTTELVAIIQNLYPTLLVKEIYKIGAIELNSNNWKIISNTGTFILKRADISKQQTLSAQAEWASQLSSSAFPTLKFLKNKDGEIISVDKNYIYCLSYFENGNYFGSSINDWESLIYNLKTLTNYSTKSKPIKSNIPERAYFTKEEDLLILQLKSATEIKSISEKEIKQVITEYEQAKINFHSDKYTPSIFHVDIHPHNLIFENNKLVLLTDFEAFQHTIIEVSLGFGIYKCLRQLLSLTENKEEQKATILKLKSQFENIFQKQNFNELIVLAKVDILKRLLYILKEMHEKGASKWLFIFETQLSSLNEINEIINTQK